MQAMGCRWAEVRVWGRVRVGTGTGGELGEELRFPSSLGPLPRGFQSKEEAAKVFIPNNFFIYIIAGGLVPGLTPHLVLGLRYVLPERLLLQYLHRDHGWLSLATVNSRSGFCFRRERSPEASVDVAFPTGCQKKQQSPKRSFLWQLLDLSFGFLAKSSSHAQC